MIYENNPFIKYTYNLLTLLDTIHINNNIKLLSLPYFKNFYYQFKNTYIYVYNNFFNVKTNNEYIIIKKEVYNVSNNNIKINDFMSSDIIEKTKNLSYKYTFTFQKNIIYFITNKILPLSIYIHNKTTNKIKDLLCLIETLKIIFQRQNFTQEITLFDLNIKKNLPIVKKFNKKNNTNMILGPNNCNSGLTELNNNYNGKIILYRNEELIKVCIHELMHSNLIDTELIFSPISKKFTEQFCFHYDVLMNEAYTECISVIIHSIYIGIKLNKKQEYINKLFNNEIKYSIYNASKILHYYKINSIYTIKKNNGICNDYFNQTTNVFSYYFLKLILFIKLKDLHNLLELYTEKFKINNSVMNNELYNLFMNNIFLIDKYNLKLKKYNSSLRLTLYEIR